MSLNDFAREEMYPRGLTKEQIADPYAVIDDFFSYSHLPDMRTSLTELQRILVVGDWHQLTRRERADMMYFLSWLNKMIECVHIIHSRTGKKMLYNPAS
jgi:hypothetical protein